jgi:hypothetical protein
VVNRVGLPRATLVTLLSFPCSHGFQNGVLNMIWDAKSSKMKEPNVNEGKQAMGFHTNTTIVQGIFKGVRK